MASHEGQVYVVRAGTVSTIDDGGALVPVLTGLPGQGDDQANQLVFQDGWMYLAIGTVTNSAVVETDNAVLGWLEQPEKRQLHDVPCEDIRLTDQTFQAENPLDEPENQVKDPEARVGELQRRSPALSSCQWDWSYLPDRGG